MGLNTGTCSRTFRISSRGWFCLLFSSSSKFRSARSFLSAESVVFFSDFFLSTFVISNIGVFPLNERCFCCFTGDFENDLRFLFTRDFEFYFPGDFSFRSFWAFFEVSFSFAEMHVLKKFVLMPFFSVEEKFVLMGFVWCDGFFFFLSKKSLFWWLLFGEIWWVLKNSRRKVCSDGFCFRWDSIKNEVSTKEALFSHIYFCPDATFCVELFVDDKWVGPFW